MSRNLALYFEKSKQMDDLFTLKSGEKVSVPKTQIRFGQNASTFEPKRKGV